MTLKEAKGAYSALPVLLPSMLRLAHPGQIPKPACHGAADSPSAAHWHVDSRQFSSASASPQLGPSDQTHRDDSDSETDSEIPAVLGHVEPRHWRRALRLTNSVISRKSTSTVTRRRRGVHDLDRLGGPHLTGNPRVVRRQRGRPEGRRLAAACPVHYPPRRRQAGCIAGQPDGWTCVWRKRVLARQNAAVGAPPTARSPASASEPPRAPRQESSLPGSGPRR